MNKTVLIVEDEAVLRDVYAFLLNNQGYKVHVAKNGAEGLEQIRTHQPDLVLLDVFMPIMDGKEVLRSINLEDYPGMKVVACTNLSDEETRREMSALGAHHYIVKATMGPQDFMGMVAELVKA